MASLVNYIITMSHCFLLKAVGDEKHTGILPSIFLFEREVAPHNFLWLVFQSQTEDLTISCVISSSRVCLRILFRVLFLPRHSSGFIPRSLMPLLHSSFICCFFSRMSVLSSRRSPNYSVQLQPLSFLSWPLTLPDKPPSWFLTLPDWPPSFSARHPFSVG